MTARRMARTLPVLLASAVLWGVPVTGAQARGYHPHYPPPHGGQQQGSPPARDDSSSPQVSPRSTRPEHCFRNYDADCDRARREYGERRS